METLTQSAKDVMTNVTNLFFKPCSAYITACRSVISSGNNLLDIPAEKSLRQFVVVVFSETARPDVVRLASDALALESEHTTSAIFLLHSTRNLGTKNACMQLFFRNVLRDGQRLCLDTGRVPYLPFDSIPVRNIHEVQAYWLKCEAVADFYLEAAASDRIDVELVKITFLHTAVEQICLGLIRVLSGYIPNTHGLHFLLELCGHFTPLPCECFPQRGAINLKRYKRLCAPPTMLRHWVQLDAPEADFLLLHESTKQFLDGARLIAKAELEKLTITDKTK